MNVNVVDVSLSTVNAWTDLPGTHDAGIFAQVISTTTNDELWGLRPNGNANFDYYQDLQNRHTWTVVGDSSGIIEGKIETTNVDFYVYGTIDSDGGGGISVTGATANYNYTGISASIDLTGEVIVTGATANYNYSGIDGTIELGAEIIVVGQTANYNYAGINGLIDITALITVTGQTANYDYGGISAEVIIQGAIVVVGSTANYDYAGVNATISLQGPIVVNPINITQAKRNSTTIRVRRNSTKIIVNETQTQNK